MTPLPPVPATATPAGLARPGRGPQDNGFADVLAAVASPARPQPDRPAPADRASDRAVDRVPERGPTGPADRAAGRAVDRAATGTPVSDRCTDEGAPAEGTSSTEDSEGVQPQSDGAPEEADVTVAPGVAAVVPTVVDGTPIVPPATGQPVDGEGGEPTTDMAVLDTPLTSEVEGHADADPQTAVPGQVDEGAQPTATASAEASASPAGAQAAAATSGTTGQAAPTSGQAADGPTEAVTATGEQPTAPQPTAQSATGDDAGSAGEAPQGDIAAESIPSTADAPVEGETTTESDLPPSVTSTRVSNSSSRSEQPTVTFGVPGANAAAGATPTGPARPAGPVTGMPMANPMSTPAGQVASAVAALRRSGSEGVHELSLEMQPAELGRVRVEVEIRAGMVNLRLAAEHDATRALLNSQLDDLRAALEQGGLESGFMEMSQHAFDRDDAQGGASSGSTSTGLPGRVGAAATTVLSAPRQHQTATSLDMLV